MRGASTRRSVLAAMAAGMAGCAGGDAVPSGDPADGSPDEGARTATPSLSTARSNSGPSSGEASRDSPVPDRFTDVYRSTIDSVVLIRVSTGDGRGAQGSGFVYDGQHLVTNQHVVEDAESVLVQFGSGAYGEADVVGTDVYSDLAVVRLPSIPDEASPLPLARRDPAIGTEVVALGNPLGYDSSISAGIVSGVDRSLPGANNFTIPDAIQTDAAVNPGNSGGPLVDLDGDVVAVINSGGGDNVGFGISAPLTRRVVPALIADGHYRHSLLGVRLSPVTPSAALANDLDSARGTMVVEVRPDGPSAGLLKGQERTVERNGREIPVGGDVIVGMGGTRIDSLNDLSSYMALETSPGDDVTVTVLRDGDRRQFEITLGVRPPA
jgi:serine protease Do